jgi:hypothetical protein
VTLRILDVLGLRFEDVATPILDEVPGLRNTA